MALESNALIVPIGIEQYGKKFITKIGRNYDVLEFGETRKAEALSKLRDQMAELKWEIWESVPMVTRKTIPSDYYKKFIDEKIGKWTLKLEDFKRGVYKNAENMPPDEVFEPIKRVASR